MLYSSFLFGHRGLFSDVRFFDGDDNGDSSGKTGEPITFNNQEDLDRLIQRRLDRQKDSLKNDKDFVGEIRAAIQSEKTAEELKEQGKFEDMYKAEVAKVESLEEKIKDLKAEVAERDLNEVRREVAVKHHIPEALINRLQGSTEEEITTDAKALAKSLNLKAEEEGEGKEEKPPVLRRKPIDNDAGKGARPHRPSGEKPGERDDDNDSRPKVGTYAFVKEGDVSWGNR